MPSSVDMRLRIGTLVIPGPFLSPSIDRQTTDNWMLLSAFPGRPPEKDTHHKYIEHKAGGRRPLAAQAQSEAMRL